VPATRLLVLADPKMLPALANGLREGGRFDVLTLPIGDSAAAGAAAQRADAMAVFYGTPDRPLPAALQALAPAVRARGGRVVGVLQREHAAQRDDCFKAGASDLLFMPMPKDQFVTRLADSVGLAYRAEPGAAAAVQVAARGSSAQLAQATVTAAGVHAAAALPFRPGETVRLSWGPFQTWGVVVRASPDAQIRFAGVTPDEEARLRDWLKGAGGGTPAHSTPAPIARPPAVAAAATAPPAGRPPGAAPRATPVPPPQSAPSRAVHSAASPSGAPTPPGRAPVAGAGRAPGNAATPPPGFANRPHIKDATPTPAGRAAPVVPAARRAAAPKASGSLEAAAPLSDLFDDGAAPPVQESAPAVGPIWPQVTAAEVCKAAGLQALRDKGAPAEAPPDIAAAARKVAGALPLGERGALDKGGGFDSHFADSMAARIALEAARVEGSRLLSSQPPALVDEAGVKWVTQMVDAAIARLQKEADGAITRGEVESLQLLRAASAALSRDLLSFKETADRLRGVISAPRLGAGSLDPEVVLPGQIYRPPPKSEPMQVRAELRDFQGLGESSSQARRRNFLVMCVLALAAAVVNLVFFAYPRVSELPSGLPGVSRIEISGTVARVTVTWDFADQQARAVPALIEALRARGVERAVLVRQNGGPAGQLAVAEGKAYGLPPPTGTPPRTAAQGPQP
jgi:DNA-binding NarL/FixJ family response regulator